MTSRSTIRQRRDHIPKIVRVVVVVVVDVGGVCVGGRVRGSVGGWNITCCKACP